MEDWRRIDIDALDPENQIQPEDSIVGQQIVPVSDEEIHSHINQIRQLVSKGAHADAIKYIVSQPPYGATPAGKLLFINSILELFSVVRQSEIDQIVKGLEVEEQTVLIKYIYKGFSVDAGKKQGGVLLTWFDKTVGVTGIGPVVRYLSDRRTV